MVSRMISRTPSEEDAKRDGANLLQEPVVPFKPSFFRYWTFLTFLVTVGLMGGTALIVGLEGFDLDMVGLAVAFANGGFLSVFFTVFIVAYFKVYVSPASLRSFNSWGACRDVKWDDILSVTPINLVGLKYLRLYSARTTSPLWVPLFLSDAQRFTNLVRQYAGPKNPLAAWFEGTKT